jgi:hypothetical protein
MNAKPTRSKINVRKTGITVVEQMLTFTARTAKQLKGGPS